MSGWATTWTMAASSSRSFATMRTPWLEPSATGFRTILSWVSKSRASLSCVAASAVTVEASATRIPRADTLSRAASLSNACRLASEPGAGNARPGLSQEGLHGSILARSTVQGEKEHQVPCFVGIDGGLELGPGACGRGREVALEGTLEREEFGPLDGGHRSVAPPEPEGRAVEDGGHVLRRGDRDSGLASVAPEENGE